MTVSVVADEFPAPASDETTPYTLVVVLHAKPEHADTVERLLAANVAPTRAEPGNVAYHLHRDRTRPADFYFYESYEGLDAFCAHLATPYIRDLLGALPPYLARDNEMIFLSAAGEEASG